MISHVHTLFERPYPVSLVQYSPDGSLLATSGGHRGNALRLWNTSSRECIAVLKGHRKRPTAATFVANGPLLVSAGVDKTVRCWDLSTFTETAAHHLHTSSVLDVAGSPDGQVVVSEGRDGRSVLWTIGGDPRNFAVVDGLMNRLAFSPDGRMLAAGGGLERQFAIVHVWDRESQSEITSLAGHSDWVLWVGFSPDGSLLASGSYGEIMLWDAGTWELRHVLRRPEDWRFSTIAFSFSSRPGLFLSGAWSHEEEKHEVHDAAGSLLGWNSTRQGLLQVWDLESGELIECIEAHPDALRSLSYSFDANHLATGGNEGSVKIWDLDLERGPSMLGDSR